MHADGKAPTRPHAPAHTDQGCICRANIYVIEWRSITCPMREKNIDFFLETSLGPARTPRYLGRQEAVHYYMAG